MNRKVSKLIKRYSKLAEQNGLQYDNRDHITTPNLYKINKRKYVKMNSIQRIAYLTRIKKDISKMGA